jgi:hypothetical protein
MHCAEYHACGSVRERVCVVQVWAGDLCEYILANHSEAKGESASLSGGRWRTAAGHTAHSFKRVLMM